MNKNKRQQKSRGRGQANNNEKGKNIPGANKFSALETIENQGKEVGHAQFNFTSQQGHGPSKTWSRKKHSRIENIPLNKVVFTATGTRNISEAALAQESQKAGSVAHTDQAQGDQTKHVETPIRERVRDNNNTTSKENTPQYNIRSSMPIKILASNHVRLIDEPEPPDIQIGMRMDTEDQGVTPMQEEEEEDREDEVIMDEETPPR